MTNPMNPVDYTARMPIQQQYYPGTMSYGFQPGYEQMFAPYYPYANMPYQTQAGYFPSYPSINPSMVGGMAQPINPQLNPKPTSTAMPTTSTPRPEPVKSSTRRTEGIINANIVVPTNVVRKGSSATEPKEVVNNIPKAELKKPEPLKDQKKEVKKQLRETAPPSKPKDQKSESVKGKEDKKAKEEPKHKEEKKMKEEKKTKDDKMVKEEIKKEPKLKEMKENIAFNNLTKPKTGKSDLEVFGEIMNNVNDSVLTYDAILRIGTELKLCQMEPSLLVNDVLERETELHNPSTGEKKVIKLKRREKTEQEKKIEEDAKRQKEHIDKMKNVEDMEGDIKLALNKLTPDNYDIMFKNIWELKSNLEKRMKQAKGEGKSEKTENVLVEQIFKKAWSEPKYIALYGTLCKEIIYKEVSNQSDSAGSDSKQSRDIMKGSQFRIEIIRKCQHTFEHRQNIREDLKKNSKKDLTDDELDYLHNQILFGSIFVFITHSYNVCRRVVQFGHN